LDERFELTVGILNGLGAHTGLYHWDSEKWTPDFGQPFKCILPTHPAA